MATINRRKFIYSTALISTMGPILSSFVNTVIKSDEEVTKNISLGVITEANNPEEDLKFARDLGFSTCQLNIARYSPELVKRLSNTLIEYKISPTALICMGPGNYVWNFIDGPSTIGLVPRENRAARVERLKQGIDFCKEVGIPAVHAHFGFIPEDPKAILYI